MLSKKLASLLSLVSLIAVPAHAGVTTLNIVGGIQPALEAAAAPTAKVSTTPATIQGVSGRWWNPSESGWGMTITQRGLIAFVNVYSFDQQGNAINYSMSSCPLSGNSCTGDIYTVSGGKPLTVPWDGTNKVLTSVGTGTLSFTDTNTATFTFTINGVAGSKSLSRMIFSTGDPVTGMLPATDYTGLWWNPNESGWGVGLTHQYGIMFATLYTFDDQGRSTRYIVSNCSATANGCAGDLYSVMGGSPLTAPWRPNLQLPKVGSVTFSFTDPNTGTMSFTINGVAGSKSISRMAFGTIVPSTYTGDALTLFNAINTFRMNMGLNPWVQNVELDALATDVFTTATKDYPVIHWPATSAYPSGYITAFEKRVPDYPFNTVGIALGSMVDRIYGRTALMRQPRSDVGISSGLKDAVWSGTQFTDEVYVAMPGNAASMTAPLDSVFVYPNDQQKGVPLILGCESASTALDISDCATAGVTIQSSPISFASAEGTTLDVTSFTIDGPGYPVARTLTSANDPNQRIPPNMAYVWRTTSFIPNTKYTATFVGAINGKPVSKSWSFTTGAGCSFDYSFGMGKLIVPVC